MQIDLPPSITTNQLEWDMIQYFLSYSLIISLVVHYVPFIFHFILSSDIVEGSNCTAVNTLHRVTRDQISILGTRSAQASFVSFGYMPEF